MTGYVFSGYKQTIKVPLVNLECKKQEDIGMVDAFLSWNARKR